MQVNLWLNWLSRLGCEQKVSSSKLVNDIFDIFLSNLLIIILDPNLYKFTTTNKNVKTIYICNTFVHNFVKTKINSNYY